MPNDRPPEARTPVTIDDLSVFLSTYQNIWILTGAGISLGSGIPTYRDHDGRWQRSDPIQHQDFITDRLSRQRYWARSMIGWQYIVTAKPNPAHNAIAQLQRTGRLSQLVTQNVDGLHQAAGSTRVADLHGNLHRIVCLDCGAGSSRAGYQSLLLNANPGIAGTIAESMPDGDADVDDALVECVNIPPCQKCAGILKPDVVFFGGTAEPRIVDMAFESLARSDAMLVIGSSLQVYSGFRFCKKAADIGIPIAAINLGTTRADELFRIKLQADCCEALPELAERLGSIPAHTSEHSAPRLLT